MREAARLGGELVDCASAVYSDLEVRQVSNGIRQEGNVPYRIVRSASDTGVGRSTSTARFTIRSKWDKRDVTDANACVLVLIHHSK